MANEKVIQGVLKLDGSGFKKGISQAEKDVLKFTASITAAAAAVSAATVMTANYQDQMIKSARQAGTTAESFSAVAHAAELSGVNTELLVTSYAKLNSVTPTVQKNLENYGIALQDVNGNTKNADQLLADIADKMASLENPAQKTALAIAAFGEEGKKMVNLLDLGSEGINNLKTEAEELGLVVSQDAGQNAEIFNDSLSNLNNSIKGVTFSISESIIEFINETGVIQTLTDTIKQASTWWRNLDDDTKDLIITTSSFVATVATGVSVFIALKAAALALAPAIATISAPVVATVAAVVALVTGIGYLITHFDEFKGKIDPVVDAIESAFRDTGVLFFIDTVSDLIDKFSDLGSETDKNTEKVSILGTVAHTVFAAIGVAIVASTAPARLLYNVLTGALEAIILLGESAQQVFGGDFVEAGETAAKSWNRLKNIGSDISTTLKDVKGNIDKILAEPLTFPVEEVEATRDAVKSLNENLNNAPTVANNATDSIKKFASESKNAVGQFQQLLGGFSSLSGAIANHIQLEGDATIRGLDAQLLAAQKSREEELSGIDEYYAKRESNLTSQYEKEKALIEQGEQAKNDAILFAQNERLLAANEEYQNSIKLLEAEYQAQKEAAQRELDLQLETFEQLTADKEQFQLVSSLLSDDLAAMLEQIETDKNTALSDLQSEFLDNQKTVQQETDAELTAQKEATNLSLTDLETQYQQTLLDTQAEAQEKRATAEMEAAQRELDLKNQINQFDYQTRVDSFNATRDIKIAEITANAIAGAIAMWGAMAGLGPLGWAAAAAASTALATAAGIAIQDLRATEVGPPPPILTMGGGGIIGGALSHSAGGVSTNLESGEAVIDTVRTDKLFDAIDNDIIPGSGGLTINFESGAIQNNGEDLGDSFLDRLSQALADRLIREGVTA